MLGSLSSLGFMAVNSSVEQIYTTPVQSPTSQDSQSMLARLQVPDMLPYPEVALDLEDVTEQKAEMLCALVIYTHPQQLQH